MDVRFGCRFDLCLLHLLLLFAFAAATLNILKLTTKIVKWNEEMLSIRCICVCGVCV